jgi:hypothetical protein
MRVSDARRVLFVHIPKTGGSTIDHLFDHEIPDTRKVKGSRRHWTYAQIIEQEPALSGYWSVGFVRNPWARMVSWWSMGNDVHARAEAGKPRAMRNVSRHPEIWEPFARYRGNFRSFVLEGTREVPRFGQAQLAWLTDADGTLVDFVGQVENFVTDVNVVREHLGLEPVPDQLRKNQSSHGHYSEYYDDELRDRVAEVFAPDIERFEYTFDDRSSAQKSG